jgi:hypothetical protein
MPQDTPLLARHGRFASLLDDLHPVVQPPCSIKRSFIRHWRKLKPTYTSVQMLVSPWPYRDVGWDEGAEPPAPWPMLEVAKRLSPPGKGRQWNSV